MTCQLFFVQDTATTWASRFGARLLRVQLTKVQPMPSHFCVDDAVTVCTTPLTAMGIDASVGIPATIGDLQKVLISNGTCLWPLQGLLPRNTAIGVTRMAGPCWRNIDSCTGQTKVHHPFIFGATVAYNPATQIYTFVANTQLDMVVSLDPLLPNWAVKVGECTAVSGQGLCS
jgi:hypothetical protein